MPLHQLSTLKGRISRVPRGVTPHVPLELDTNQRVVSLDLRENIFGDGKRVTVDWHWEAVIDTVPSDAIGRVES